MSSEFYGYVEGQAGEVTRRGSKSSGFRAWAQDGTSRVVVYLDHNEMSQDNFAEIVIDGSTLNYAAGSGLFVAKIDLCIMDYSRDPQVINAVKRASIAMQKASNRARKLAGKPALS